MPSPTLLPRYLLGIFIHSEAQQVIPELSELQPPGKATWLPRGMKEEEEEEEEVAQGKKLFSTEKASHLHLPQDFQQKGNPRQSKG